MGVVGGGVADGVVLGGLGCHWCGVCGEGGRCGQVSAGRGDLHRRTHSASGQTAAETVGPVGAANSAPVFASGSASRTVTENTASGNVGSPVTATDADSDALTYSVAESSGPDAAAVPAADLDAFNRDFEFDPAAAGQVRVKAGAAIDYEARSTYKVAYRVTDNKNAAGGSDPAVDDTIMLTISVTNLNEAGSVSVSGDPEAGATLTASVSDPDGAVSGVGWVWSVGASPTGSFSAVSGATDAAFVVRAADVGQHLRAAATYTDVTHSASGQTASETVGPVGAANSAPVFADSNNDGTADAVSRTVTENTTTGDVGAAVTATDADSDALTYSVAESSGPDAAADLADFNRHFSLDAATGQISVGAGAAIDYETRNTYKVAYQVTDNKNSAGSVDTAVDDTLVLTINVTDANEAPVFAAGSVSRTVTENTTTGECGGADHRGRSRLGSCAGLFGGGDLRDGRGGGSGRFQPGLLAGRGYGPDQRGGRRGDRLRDPQHLQGGLPGHRQQERGGRQRSRGGRHAGVDDQCDQL